MYVPLLLLRNCLTNVCLAGLWNVAVALAKREEHRSAHELAERALAAIRTTPNIPTLLGAAGLATAAGNHLRAIELFEAGIEQGLKLSKGELAEIFNRAAADRAESALQVCRCSTMPLAQFPVSILPL